MVVGEIYVDIPSQIAETYAAVSLRLLTAPSISVFSVIG